MTPTEEKLLDALIACRDRFAFYVGHHLDKGDLAKAAENEMFVALANEAIAAAGHVEPPNFCARCGKRLVADGVHTCTPPMAGGIQACAAAMSHDAELEQARAKEREACARLCEKPRTTPIAMTEWCQGYDSASRNIAAAIRARGQK